MDSARPPGLSTTAPASSEAQGGSTQGLGGSENGSKQRVEVAPKITSWVGVASEKKILRKYNLDVTDSEGQLNLEIPDEVVFNANPLWEDFLNRKVLRHCASYSEDSRCCQQDMARWRQGETSGSLRS